MAEVEDNERTILDYLNEDCLRAVLQFVPVQDLIRTERASRRWQGMVLTYLRSIHHGIKIASPFSKKKEDPINVCILCPSKYKSFESWIEKLGASVASAYCDSLKSLSIIKEGCPNLRALEVYHFRRSCKKNITHNLLDSFKLLQQVSFYESSMGDGGFTKFLEGIALEKMEFLACSNFTGLCFADINTSNLKYLSFYGCHQLQPIKFRVMECLGEVTELKVINCYMILDHVMQFMLEKTPKLERLELLGDRHFPEKVSNLPRLQHLSVTFLGTWDLEHLLKGWKELRSLTLFCRDISTFDSSRHIFEPICQNGARLSVLKLVGFYVVDDDVLRLVQACPALEVLTVKGVGGLSRELPLRVSAVLSGRRLRLHLVDYHIEKTQDESAGRREEMKTKYENLTVVFEKTVY